MCNSKLLLETVFSIVVNAEQEFAVGRALQFRGDLRMEAEEWPLLEPLSGKLPVKTLWVEKGLACMLVICKVWKLAMAL
jgi:hypothetical protein